MDEFKFQFISNDTCKLSHIKFKKIVQQILNKSEVYIACKRRHTLNIRIQKSVEQNDGKREL